MAEVSKTALYEALDAARRWLEEQAAREEGSGEWYALNNFRKFLDAVEVAPSADEIARASRALGWHIADQFGTDECWQAITAFNERIRRIGKEMARHESKQSTPDG